MMITIVICGAAIIVVGLSIFILGPAPANSPFRSFKHLPGQSPVNKLINGSSEASDVVLPDIFNEQEIINQLRQLQNSPTIFDMYVQRLWHKFNSHNEKKLLLDWVSTFEVGKQVIDANIELQRANNERRRLHLEDKIIRKEADVRIAQLEADEQEAKLRKDGLVQQRQHIKNPPAPSKLETPQEPTDSVLAEQQRKLEQLQREKQAEKYKVLNDPSLSEEERKERLNYLEANYQKELVKLQIGFGGFEDD